MIFSGVYAITDSNLLFGNDLIESVTEALEGGISLLQYRNKDGSWQERLDEAKILQTLCADYSVPLIINDDLSLCLAIHASGIHLGQTDRAVKEVRSQLGSKAIIGVTCHSNIEAALQAQSDGADYVAFGRFFPSTTKPQASGAEISILTEAKDKLSIPVVAIGGINTENAQSVIDAGADMIAVINCLFKDNHVKPRAKLLAKLFTE